jgi:membrane protein required for colicin V production
MSFSYVDIIIALPLAYWLIKGLKNGFAHEFLGLLGQILAIFLAFTYMEPMGAILIGYIKMSGAAVPLVAFILIYIIFMILVHLLIKVINRFVEVIFLSTFNKILGAFFSTFKAALVLSVVFILLAGLDTPKKESRDDSMLYSYVLPIAPATYNLVAFLWPGVSSFTDQAGDFIDQYNPFKDKDFTNPE